MTDNTQTSYSESRTGKGDRWYQQIRDLKAQAEGLTKYAESHRMFSVMIEESLSSLPLDNSREIARAELQEFCSKRMSHAHQTIARKLKQIQDLESVGVNG